MTGPALTGGSLGRAFRGTAGRQARQEVRREARQRRHDRLARGMDLAVAIVLLVPATPVMAAVAVAVRRRMGSPVLFRQERAGQHGRSFTIYKFRTMLDERGPDGVERSEAERLTALGELLRSWSLDELPQLVNVLRGEMGLVGPRPLYPSYLPLYSPEQARRHLVRPGLTGLAQVSGRNSLTWEEKFALDVRYVDSRSLWLDLRLLVATAHRVLSRSDVRTPGYATSPMFTGSPVLAEAAEAADAAADLAGPGAGSAPLEEAG
jgi:lipopolysaccharide/colanic/teichoic acid biosynthesis glycosyltransferase